MMFSLAVGIIDYPFIYNHASLFRRFAQIAVNTIVASHIVAAVIPSAVLRSFGDFFFRFSRVFGIDGV